MIWKCEDGHATAIIICDGHDEAIHKFAAQQDREAGVVTCYPLGKELSNIHPAFYIVQKEPV